MKKNSLKSILARLSCLGLVLTWGQNCLAQTNSFGIPDLPASGTYTDEQVFYSGLIVGLVLGGWGWVWRLVRQVGHQNPEI